MSIVECTVANNGSGIDGINSVLAVSGSELLNNSNYGVIDQFGGSVEITDSLFSGNACAIGVQQASL